LQRQMIIDFPAVARFSVHATIALSLMSLMATSSPVLALDILVGSSQRNTFNYHVGRVLCRVINGQATDLNCDVLAAEQGLDSSDQVHTLTNVHNGALDLGIIDSGVQYDAANSSGRFEYFDINLENIRSLFSLNGVPFTLIARGNGNLESVVDLKGKKINIGNPGSPQRAIMNNLMRVNDWEKTDFLLIEELPATQSQDMLALCFGTVDAVVRFNVHPNADTKHMVDLCGASLLDVSGAAVEKLTSDSPFYSAMSIPAGIYSSNVAAVSTLGLLDTVITSEDLDDETAYSIVKTVFENLDRLRAAHPAFSSLTPENMYSRGLSAPLHPGALKYYREQGLMP
jgi:TRAP transporter TAXI family solute receptor